MTGQFNKLGGNFNAYSGCNTINKTVSRASRLIRSRERVPRQNWAYRTEIAFCFLATDFGLNRVAISEHWNATKDDDNTKFIF